MSDNKPYTLQDAINNPKGCILKILKWFCIIFVLIIVIGLFLPEQEGQNNNNNNESIINKSNFTGTWALTVNTAKLHHIKINGELDGVEITINNKTYTLTRNIEDREFLPNNLWLDSEFEQVGQYKVCNDVMLDKRTCKKSLADIINYAEKLPIEN